VAGISGGEIREMDGESTLPFCALWVGGGKAVEDYRSPRRSALMRIKAICASFWSAPLLWRFSTSAKLGWTTGGDGRNAGRVTGISGGERRETDHAQQSPSTSWKIQLALKIMDQRFQEIIQQVEPIQHPVYGLLYRCSLALQDGT
jgi:hypothetical protein